MLISEYQALAARTLPPVTGIRSDDRHSRMVLALGLFGEAGEVAELIKKVEGHGHDLDKARLAEELGDLAWYLAGVATAYGLDLGTVAADNIEKLKRRYPAGFSEQASRERNHD